MVFTDYTLAEIRQRLQEEFGIKDDPGGNNLILDKRINDGVAWIARARPNWPWLRKEHTIDVPAPTSGTVTFTQGSRAISGIAPNLRDIINPETSGDTPSLGYMVSSLAPLEIAQQWTAPTEAKSSRIAQGFFQLPADFIRMDSAPLMVKSLHDPRMRYAQPTKFNELKYAGVTTVASTRYYTVVKDPIEDDTLAVSGRFLAVFPYIAQLEVLKMKYWRAAPKLVNDADTPIVPWEDRLTVWWACAWFVAQWQEDPRVAIYNNGAVSALADMKHEYDFSDDEMEDDEMVTDPTGFIYPPSGYEDFERGY